MVVVSLISMIFVLGSRRLLRMASLRARMDRVVLNIGRGIGVGSWRLQSTMCTAFTNIECTAKISLVGVINVAGVLVFVDNRSLNTEWL